MGETLHIDTACEQNSTGTPSALARLVIALDHLARLSGVISAAMIPVMVLLTFVVVILRYGFDIGSIALQETIIYLHSWVFLVAMAYTLKADGQVRVDIFYRRFNPAQQAWVNAIGGVLFLLPLCTILLITCTEYALRSWAIGETSAEAGGLPLVYLLKSMLPLAAFILLLQAVADVLANTLLLIQRPVSRPDV